MKISFIGTGTIIPTPRKSNKPFRSYSAIFIEIGKDSLLFDIGPGTLTKMQQLGIDTRVQPSHLFISHYHIDHCQDLIGLVKGRCFDPKTMKKIVKNTLSVFGPVHLDEWCHDLFEHNQRWDYMTKELSVFEQMTLKGVHEGLVNETSNWKVTCIPVRHANGVAYRLDAQGKSFVFSGDMGYDDNFAKLGQYADLAVIECSHPNRQSLLGLHLCPEDVGNLAKLGKFKRVILTHLYPTCEGKEKDMIRQVRKIFPVQTQAAYDFLQIEL